MSAWDPWWVHGDYAETYHAAREDDGEDRMSRFWDRDVVRRAYEISEEKTRQGRAIGDWIGDHYQAYRERIKTPLERRIEQEWSGPYQEPPCRQAHGACDDNRSCLRCAAPWGHPCRQALRSSTGEVKL